MRSSAIPTNPDADIYNETSPSLTAMGRLFFVICFCVAGDRKVGSRHSLLLLKVHLGEEQLTIFIQISEGFRHIILIDHQGDGEVIAAITGEGVAVREPT